MSLQNVVGYLNYLQNLFQIILKFQQIVAMRGMIMHETSSLDEQTFQMVSDYITNNDDEVRVTLYNELVSFFNRKHKLSEKCQRNNNINDILKDPLLLSSSQRANVLSSIIDAKGFDNFIPDFIYLIWNNITFKNHISNLFIIKVK